jgi:hypothetical protein
MTFGLMKDLKQHVRMTRAQHGAWAAAMLIFTPACAAAAAACGTAAQGEGYPNFCTIPHAPTDVRPADAFHAAVLDTRLAGRRVERETAPDTFSLPLGAAESFAQAARAQAAAPPPADTGPASGDAEAFAAEARKMATPPVRPRR